MPPKSKKKPVQQKEKPEEESVGKENDEQDNSQEDTQEEPSFVSNDRVLWLRNVIRAQAKDILQEMVDSKLGKIENNSTFNQFIRSVIKSETVSLVEKLNNLTEDCNKKQRRIERLEYEKCQNEGEIKTLKLQLDKIQQEKYDHSLQVVGLPESQNNSGDIKQIVRLSKEKLGIKLKANDLEEVTRLGKKNESKTRNTVLKFKDKSLRDKVFESRKKTITNSDPKKNIYINDKLTKHRQNLLYAARNLVKAKKLFAAWSQSGNILIRKSENDKIVEIHDHSDLRDMRIDENFQHEMELLRGNTSNASGGSSSSGRLSIVSHISDYDYYVDSDM